MYEIKITECKKVSIGTILKELIDDGRNDGRFKNNADFVNQFSAWVAKRFAEDGEPAEDYSDLTEQQLSAWIRGKNQPKKGLKLSMLAEFLGVSEAYLCCETTNRTRLKRSVSWDDFIKRHQSCQALDALSEEVKHHKQVSDFKAYCGLLGINFDYEPTAERKVVFNESYIEDGVRYSVEITDYEGDNPITYVKYSDGQTMQITDDQLYALIKECNSFIKFKFSELKKEVEENGKGNRTED